MDRRTFIAIALCFGIFLGWQKLYLEPRALQAQQQAQHEAAQQAPQASAPQSAAPSAQGLAPAAPATAVVPQERKTIGVATPSGDARLSDGIRLLNSWSLKGYTNEKDPTKLTGLQDVTNVPEQVELAFDDSSYAYLSNAQGSLSAANGGAVWIYDDNNLRLSKEFVSVPDQPYVSLKISGTFKTKRPNYLFVSVANQTKENDHEAQDRALFYFTNNSIERALAKDSVSLKEIPTPVKYIGTESRYFALALVSQSPIEPKGLIQPLASGQHRLSFVYPLTADSFTLPFKLYFGPKELDKLRAVEPALDHAVDFGFFTVFAYPLLKLLKWFYGFVHNYGVAIILLTLLVKLVTFPLNYKSMKSMKQMARLQPQINALREKYKDDKEALNREMLSFMRNNGYNPVSGCLPILVQMPIFFALYRVLYSSIELYQAPFMLWITDLSAKDPIYVTPVLLTLTMFIQQKMTPNTATDPMQAKMLQWMPVIFGVFMLTLPSGLTLYMLVNAAASILQQWLLNKKLDPAYGKARA